MRKIAILLLAVLVFGMSFAFADTAYAGNRSAIPAFGAGIVLGAAAGIIFSHHPRPYPNHNPYPWYHHPHPVVIYAPPPPPSVHVWIPEQMVWQNVQRCDHYRYCRNELVQIFVPGHWEHR